MIELQWQNWSPVGIKDSSRAQFGFESLVPYSYVMCLSTEEQEQELASFSEIKALTFKSLESCLKFLQKCKSTEDIAEISDDQSVTEIITDPALLPARVDPDVILCRLALWEGSGAWIAQIFHEFHEASFKEIICIGNINRTAIRIKDIKLGFRVALTPFPENLRLVAVPFKIQVDGREHDYSGRDLIEGRFANSDNTITNLPWNQVPDLVDLGKLRSEAWALTFQKDPSATFLVAKYNNDHIELATCEVEEVAGEKMLRFGGAGFSLYSEPQEATSIQPGEYFQFGTTYYEIVGGSWKDAYYAYRDFLASQGHGIPADYNPPVNWNELYDVGWYHSDEDALAEFYTRDALLEEGRKAHEIGCDLLYLDPGWEVCEGSTLWDETRLGPLDEFIHELDNTYNIGLAFRTIGRVYRDIYPSEWMVAHQELVKTTPPPPKPPFTFRNFSEPCTGVAEWRAMKQDRILQIAGTGMRFIMFDEYDWRGSCFDAGHGHLVPTTPSEHAKVVFSLCRAVRDQFPGILIETHDPIWPWQCRYLPTYFQQGFVGGAYQENWGFEFMWSPLKDLQSGKALALYYYALGNPIPLYLHIPMSPDNEHSIFFWWVASTVRHLGIGGKVGSDTVTPPDVLQQHDPASRWEQYKDNMRIYLQLKPFFTRGTFYGITKECHLHVLPRRIGGIVNLFNLSHENAEKQFIIPRNLLGLSIDSEETLPVEGAESHWMLEGVQLTAMVPAWGHCLVKIGEIE